MVICGDKELLIMEKSFYTPSEKIATKLQELANVMQEKFDNKIICSNYSFGELSVTVNKDSLLDVITFLRNDPRYLFRQLSDITAVDYPEKENRFTLVYQLLSLSFNLRVRIKIEITESYVVPSVFNQYSNADWLEREVFDMFGIYFSDHPDLRRILTDFGFEGYPLRKDFPLSGHTEVYFDKETQQVKYKPVELEQEYRNFSSINPWLNLDKNKSN